MASTHIVMVNYNAGAWLQRSLESALNFSHGGVTVVDNLSSDSSVSDAQAVFDDARLEWQLNHQNLGFAAANNQVLKELTCDYAVLMNPDCELNANSLAPIIEAMQSNPKIGLASCRILNEDGSLQITCRRKFPTPGSALVRILQLNRLFPNNPKFANFDYGDSIDANSPVELVEAISGAFMVARISAVQQVGLLDEGYFMHCEDLDWCKRFALNHWQVALVPAATVIHAKGVSSKSRPIAVLYTLHTGMNRFFDKFYQNSYNLPVRLLVKLGIASSFLLRASISLVKGALGR
ncbi:MAG: GT2 family glycosyltransferase [Arenicella sp.]|jgi:GT2 family glycosyltransferase